MMNQHGTAIITLAGLMNALKVTGKELDKVKIVMNGAGAAAIAIAKLLITSGAKDVTMCDRAGAIYEGREAGMNPVKEEMAENYQLEKRAGKPCGYCQRGRCIYRRICTESAHR